MAENNNQVRFLIEVDLTNLANGEAAVKIACDQVPMPFAAATVATEHMMTLCALQSPQGDFEKALKLLCDGARTNKVTAFGGHKTV